jgi:hypothetical protein
LVVCEIVLRRRAKESDGMSPRFLRPYIHVLQLCMRIGRDGLKMDKRPDIRTVRPGAAFHYHRIARGDELVSDGSDEGNHLLDIDGDQIKRTQALMLRAEMRLYCVVVMTPAPAVRAKWHVSEDLSDGSDLHPQGFA